MMKLVSFCMPAYNAAPYIAETLDNLLAQDYPAIEIIVVNDGSTDDTLRIAKRYQGPRVKVIDQPNAGQSAAENRAIREAQGEFIVFHDADDLVTADKLTAQLDRLHHQNDPFIATCAWGRFHSNPKDAYFRPSPLWQDMKPLDWLRTAWENHLMMHGATWLIPRCLIDKAGPWDERLSLINDHEYFCRVMLHAKEILFCDGPRTYYRSNLAQSLSGTKSRAAWTSALLSLELSTRHVLAVDGSPAMRHACAAKLQRFIYEVYPEHPDLRARAANFVRELGGTRIPPMGGRWFHMARRVVGWRMARQLEIFSRRILRS